MCKSYCGPVINSAGGPARGFRTGLVHFQVLTEMLTEIEPFLIDWFDELG